MLNQTSIGTENRFPWDNSTEKEKKVALRCWLLMVRICTALLHSVASSLGLPYEILEPLAQSLNSDYEKVRYHFNTTNTLVNISDWLTVTFPTVYTVQTGARASR